jgi:hypothetical protein
MHALGLLRKRNVEHIFSKEKNTAPFVYGTIQRNHSFHSGGCGDIQEPLYIADNQKLFPSFFVKLLKTYYRRRQKNNDQLANPTPIHHRPLSAKFNVVSISVPCTRGAGGGRDSISGCNKCGDYT